MTRENWRCGIVGLRKHVLGGIEVWHVFDGVFGEGTVRRHPCVGDTSGDSERSRRILPTGGEDSRRLALAGVMGVPTTANEEEGPVRIRPVLPRVSSATQTCVTPARLGQRGVDAVRRAIVAIVAVRELRSEGVAVRSAAGARVVPPPVGTDRAWLRYASAGGGVAGRHCGVRVERV